MTVAIHTMQQESSPDSAAAASPGPARLPVVPTHAIMVSIATAYIIGILRAVFAGFCESPANKLPEFGVGTVDKRARHPDGRREGVPCGQTEAATEQPIAAPAWPSYGTHPPLRNLCVLRTVRAAGSGFRGRHRALCAGRGILGRLFGLREAARPRTWRYVIAHRMRDKVAPASCSHAVQELREIC